MEKKERAKQAGPGAGKGGPVGPLFLVGLGLCDEQDVSARSIELLRTCTGLFAESYTNLMREGTLRRLEEKIGRKIKPLGREEVESEKIILDACSLGPTALLVPGDPMTATTHSSLITAAKEKGIEAHILHASSIFTAAPGAAGLQIYKMGKTATITYWRKNYEPAAFIDIVAENLARGAHTLCLLDIDPEMGCMKPSQALEIMEKAQEKRKKENPALAPVLSPATPLFVLWHVGWPDQKIWAGKKEHYPYSGRPQKEPGSGPAASAPSREPDGPAVILIAGKMHFAEEENWKSLSR
ncbi:Diphthine synthase [uncultured archaeon]|nr:Diphthine synthase [uncultured archaeon]